MAEWYNIASCHCGAGLGIYDFKKANCSFALLRLMIELCLIEQWLIKCPFGKAAEA